jgi:hypothetical protein
MKKVRQLNIESMNSVSSVAGRSSIDMDNLFRMKEEYIFVFGKISSLICNSWGELRA